MIRKLPLAKITEKEKSDKFLLVNCSLVLLKPGGILPSEVAGRSLDNSGLGGLAECVGLLPAGWTGGAAVVIWCHHDYHSP